MTKCDHVWIVTEWQLNYRSTNSDNGYTVPTFQKAIELTCSKCLVTKKP